MTHPQALPSRPIRAQLGDFSSVVCFKSLITGVEDTLSADGAAVVFTQAGRLRGQTLARQLGVAGMAVAPDALAPLLDAAIGWEGTRLCAVTRSYLDGEKCVIETQETVCSAGEPQGSGRDCTFTLGAVWGALEAITGQRYEGRQTASILRGGSSDTFEFSPL